jgi:ABC-2 type transport system permease protein
MMLLGLWKLTWLEIKIFAREPLGLIGSVAVPVALFLVLSRLTRGRTRIDASNLPRFISTDLPVLASLLIVASAVLSLIAIIAIYREGGILKRLRATPLRPHTILMAHVLVKLIFTAVTLGAMVLAGRRYYPVDADVPLASFVVALLFTTGSLVSLGFVVASVVPTARFAQPIGTLVLYPMIALSGLFIPVESLPPMFQIVARGVPLTYAVSLLRGIWHGDGWLVHAGDVAVLSVMFAIFMAIAARVFRWE